MIDTEALRNKVIDLALQGKLTQQLPEDGNAEELYAQIKKESIKLIKVGKIKQTKRLSEINTDEIPFKIPSNWKWVRLNDLYEINPKVEAESDADAAFIPMEMISAGFAKSYSYETQKWEVASKNHTKFQNGDVAFAKISPCFENRKSFIAHNLPGGVGGGTTELIILRQTYILPDYTYYVITDQRFICAGSQSYKGIVGQQRVKAENIRSYLVALPPLEEQKRIVNIIETAFTQIDKIDTLQKRYESDRDTLKRKIIDAGIRGKLTQQLPEDGDAEALYAQIKEGKSKLIKEGKIKKEKLLPEITEDEIPFELPVHWKWVRLAEISSTNIGLTYHPQDVVANGTVVLRSNNIQNGQFDYSDLLSVNCDIRENQLIHKNDILICSRNGSKKLVGKCAIYGGELGVVSFGAFMAILRSPCYKFLYYYLNTCFFRRYFLNDDTKQINQVTQDILKMAIVPLPPLNEQLRIVQKIDEALNILP